MGITLENALASGVERMTERAMTDGRGASGIEPATIPYRLVEYARRMRCAR